MDEARQAFEGTLDDIISSGANPFMELRRAIMRMAHFVDNGSMWWLIHDRRDEKRAIGIRVRRAFPV